MSVSTQKLATGAAATAAGAGAAWASETNARDGTAASPDNNTYATAAAPAKNAFTGSVWPFVFAVGDVPDNATILSVLVEVQWKMAAATTTYTLDASCYANANETTPLSAVPGVSHATGPTADTTESFSLTTLPTIAQLRAGIYVRVKHSRGTSNTATTASLDFIRVTVTYSVPTVTNISLAAGMTMTSTTTAQHSVAKTISAAVVGTPANALITGRNQALTTMASLAVQRMQPRALSAALSAAPALQAARKLYQALAASMTLSGALAFQRTHLTPMTVSLSLNPVPSMQRLMARALAATMLETPAQQKRQYRALAQTMLASPVVVEQKKLYRSIPLSITLAPASTQKSMIGFLLNALTSLASSMKSVVLRRADAQSVLVADTTRRVSEALANGIVLAPDVTLVQGRPTVQITLNAQMVLAAESNRTVQEALATISALIADMGTSRVYAYPWITSILDVAGRVTAAGEAKIKLTSAEDPLANRITGGKGV